MEEVEKEDIPCLQKALIDREFPALKGLTYLDHAGATLYSRSQLSLVVEQLNAEVFGNPHSRNPSSRLATDHVDQVRHKVLAHFRTSAEEYSVVFTSGATGACKLLAESFNWESDGTFAYLEENHTSVFGMREIARARNARLAALSYEEVRLATLSHDVGGERGSADSLFAYPAQCNFSGFKYPLDWVERVRGNALDVAVGGRGRWYVLLDAAALVATSPLDLAETKPDFVCVSFYKMFGYPTGIGALLVRRGAEEALCKEYFGGGTVLVALPRQGFHVPRPVLHDRLEDGTINFQGILAVAHGLETLERLGGGMDEISGRTHGLARYAVERLGALRHGNGKPVAVVYGRGDFARRETQGGTVGFNLVRGDGSFVGFAEVEKFSELFNIHLRTGCFCNPGACLHYLGLSEEDMKKHYAAGHVCGDDLDLVEGRPTGSVRISFGYMSTKRDADSFLRMIEECFCESESPAPSIPREISSRSDPGRISLTDVFVYPVKSCGGVAARDWPLTGTGLAYDRTWMVATSAGVPLTQKREIRLCALQPRVDFGTNRLVLAFPGHPDATVPLDPNATQPTEKKDARTSKVCGDPVSTLDCGDEAAEWLSRVFGRDDLRLLRQNPVASRKKNAREVSLANDSQYLLVSRASVRDVLGRLREKGVDIEEDRLVARFRPNLVVDGDGETLAPFAEDAWESLGIGSSSFKCHGLCSRCQMVCIDQETGEKTKEPLATLSGFRGAKASFGIYLSRTSGKRLCVGDSVLSGSFGTQ